MSVCLLLDSLQPLQTDSDKAEVTEKRRKRGSRKIEEDSSCDDDDDELWKSMECVTEKKQTKTASEDDKITVVLLQ